MGNRYLATVLGTGPTHTVGFVGSGLIVRPLIHTFTEHIIGTQPHNSAGVRVGSLKSLHYRTLEPKGPISATKTVVLPSVFPSFSLK